MNDNPRKIIEHPTVDNRTDKQTFTYADGAKVSIQTGDGSILEFRDAIFLLADAQYQLHKIFNG